MPWTTPRTWTTEPVTATLLNQQIRDNLNFLKDPPTAIYTGDASNITTASASFVDIGANFILTLDTYGGDMLVHFEGNFEHSAPGTINVTFTVDGVAYIPDDGIIRIVASPAGEGGNYLGTFTVLVPALAVGTHVFAMQWKTSAATATLLVGAGTANGRDVHPQFWVREIS